jgi:hypothetical protein
VSCILEKRQEGELHSKLLPCSEYCIFWGGDTRRLNFICRHFGTPCQFHLHRWCKQRRFSLAYVLQGSTWWSLPSTVSLSTRTRPHPIGSGNFEPKLYLYKYPSNVVLSDPRYTNHLVASHRSGQEENCPKDGYAGSPPE